MEIDYHYCAITNTPEGVAYADGVITRVSPIDGNSIQSVRETIAGVMEAPVEKINIVSLTRL